jgi:hypothetical protein
MGYLSESDSTLSLAVPRLELAFEDLADSLGWTPAELDSVLIHLENYANGRDSTESAIERLSNCASSSDITQREASYIQEIGFAFDTATDSADLISRFAAIETDMAQESWDDGEHRALVTIAVAKHSFCFWYELC